MAVYARDKDKDRTRGTMGTLGINTHRLRIDEGELFMDISPLERLRQPDPTAAYHNLLIMVEKEKEERRMRRCHSLKLQRTEGEGTKEDTHAHTHTEGDPVKIQRGAGAYG
jgi:hypothetical protein